MLLENPSQILNRLFFAVMVLIGALPHASASEALQCSTDDEVLTLDLGYERAIREVDIPFLEQLLAEEYLWMHNLASTSDTRQALFERLQAPSYEPPLSRKSDQVRILRLQNTVVLHGVSTVKKPVNPTIPSSGIAFNQYQFVRTYVQTAKGCRLLSSQTMKVQSGTEGLSVSDER